MPTAPSIAGKRTKRETERPKVPQSKRSRERLIA